jgi:hypothetical protein
MPLLTVEVKSIFAAVPGTKLSGLRPVVLMEETPLEPGKTGFAVGVVVEGEAVGVFVEGEVVGVSVGVDVVGNCVGVKVGLLMGTFDGARVGYSVSAGHSHRLAKSLALAEEVMTDTRYLVEHTRYPPIQTNTHIHTFFHSLTPTHSLTHSFTHSLTQSITHLLSHTLTNHSIHITEKNYSRKHCAHVHTK